MLLVPLPKKTNKSYESNSANNKKWLDKHQGADWFQNQQVQLFWNVQDCSLIGKRLLANSPAEVKGRAVLHFIYFSRSENGRLDFRSIGTVTYTLFNRQEQNFLKDI